MTGIKIRTSLRTLIVIFKYCFMFLVINNHKVALTAAMANDVDSLKEFLSSYPEAVRFCMFFVLSARCSPYAQPMSVST